MAESEQPSAEQPAVPPVAPVASTQVVEQVVGRTSDPATGVVMEHVVRTVPPTPDAVSTQTATGAVAPTPVAPAPVAPTHVAAAPAAAAAPVRETAPHAPPGDIDETYYDGSPLLRGEFSRVATYGLVAIVLFAIPVLAARLARNGHLGWWHWWLTVAFVLAGIVVLIVPFMLTKSVRYVVTNYRISRERGVLTKDIDTLELWHVEDLTFRQSVYQRIMGVGTIHILSHDRENPNLVLESVPNARKLFSTLQQRVIAVKRTGGVVKVDTGS